MERSEFIMGAYGGDDDFVYPGGIDPFGDLMGNGRFRDRDNDHSNEFLSKNAPPSNVTTRQTIIEDMKRLLGSGAVEVELEADDYSTALRLSLDRYRQRSGNAVEESYTFLRLEYAQNEYYLPEEVISVRTLFRRGIGDTASGTDLDPFSLAYTNLYLLQAASGGGYSAGLLSYELYTDYVKQAGRMFGRDLLYTFDVSTKKLTLMRRPGGDAETILIWCYMYRPDALILNDPFARPWIRDYALTYCKEMLGQAYGKFNGAVIGPQGGTTLKSASLLAEVVAERERLEKEIDNYVDMGSFGILGVVIG
jgi:hypothetical protein